MTAHTKLSSDGRVIVPKDVVDRQGWQPETELEVVESRDGVLIRPKQLNKEGISWEEFRRRVPPHDGPPASLEDMDRAIEREAVRRYVEKERRSR